MGRRGMGWIAGVLLGLLGSAPAVAQGTTGTITGQVLHEGTGQPLAGVQVYVVGTRIGAVSDAGGRFRLVGVPVGRVQLRAQTVGFSTATQTVTVGPGQTVTVTFRLAPSAIALEELVVTGAGVATERRRLGNTVATLSAAQLENKPIKTFSEALAGREPGVNLLPNTGLTGEGASIRIRGTHSMVQSSEPVVYVDGVRVDIYGGRGYIGTGGGGRPSRLDDIDPNSIERIEVLKGAAASTLYGSEASAGVIQIFTKRGSAGAPRWDLQLETGWLRYPDRIPPNAGYVTTQADAQRLSTWFGIPIEPYQVFTRDFVKPLLETGVSRSAHLSVTGGSSAVTYAANGRYEFEDGPIGGDEFRGARDLAKRVSGTISMAIYPLERLTLRVSSFYTQTIANTINNNNIYAPLTLAMFGQPQRASCVTPRKRSNPIPGTGRCDGPGNPFGQAAFATVAEAFQRRIEQTSDNFLGTINANYRASENLTLDATFGANVVNQQDLLYYPFGHDVDGFTANNLAGAKTISDRNFRQYTLDAKLAWQRPLRANLTSELVVGGQGYVLQEEQSGGFGRDFPGPGFEIAQAGSYQEVYETYSSVVNLGLVAQEQLGWNDWVFLTVGARYDYNSTFGKSAGGAFYPKASVSILPSALPSWRSSLLSTLRLRAAIGRAGLQPRAFDKFTTYSSIRSEFGAAIQPANLGNPDLKPEVTTELELGTELGLFDNRVAFDVTYWDRRTTDALVSYQFPVSGGFLQRQVVNLGRLRGRGVEMSLRGTALQRRTLTVNLFASAAYLWERIESLGGAPPLKLGESYTRYRNWYKEGYAPGSFFGPRVRRDVEYPIDVNGDCQPDDKATLLAYFSQPRPVSTTGPWRVVVEGGDPRPCGGGGNFLDFYLGKPTPDWSGSFGGDVTWGPFALSTLFEFKAGNFKVHNLTYGFRKAHPSLGGNLEAAVRAKATIENPNSTPEQRLEAAKEWVTKYVALSPYDGLNEIEDGDFLRWRELSLTYNAPARWAQRLGARRLSVSAGVRNLMLWTKYSGADPEVNLLGRSTAGGLDNIALGIDAFGMPLPRRFSFTVRLGF